MAHETAQLWAEWVDGRECKRCRATKKPWDFPRVVAIAFPQGWKLTEPPGLNPDHCKDCQTKLRDN